jgi:hypothetical protein
MHEAQSFIAGYSIAEQARIAFAWNGKHATEFVDANQVFRWSIVEHCLANPGASSPLLLSHLFLADAEWSQEAWCSPHHFARLGALLLECGEGESLASFAHGFNLSFDTFGACHSMSLAPDLLERLVAATNIAVAGATDETSLKALTAARELFAKLAQGTASQGWATVAAGTPVSNVRVVWPRWYHRLWAKITGSRGAT